jgi:hypothetical protein
LTHCGKCNIIYFGESEKKFRGLRNPRKFENDESRFEKYRNEEQEQE